jgi:drug/metabolite transporter (DMT)-like permease
VQGFLTGIVALFLYGRMVSILGATSGAAFLALTPAMTALMGISILGEFPSAIDWLMIVVISIGIYTVSGGPLSGPNAARAESMRQPICRTSSGASRPTGRDRATEDVVARGD